MGEPVGRGWRLGGFGGPKPLLRGWVHAAAAVASVAVTAALGWLSLLDPPRLITMLVFGLSMIELYTVSAVYHLGLWRERAWRVLRSIDHANIFVLIAGTYTPLCFNVLSGWLRVAILTAVWALAAVGVGLAVFVPHMPRWVGTIIYIAMGWVSVLALPALIAALPWPAIALLVLGGALNTAGAVIYARRRPDPWPSVFGFHEIFHLCVVAGGVAFATVIWVWVLPYPRA
jgi:hemolysin III